MATRETKRSAGARDLDGEVSRVMDSSGVTKEPGDRRGDEVTARCGTPRS